MMRPGTIEGAKRTHAIRTLPRQNVSVSVRFCPSAGMVQSWVTLGRGNFCRKSLFLIELLPNPIGQSVTLLSGRLNHAHQRGS
jgi:hypothetical protein